MKEVEGLTGGFGDIKKAAGAIGLVEHPQQRKLQLLALIMAANQRVQAPFAQLWFTKRTQVAEYRITFHNADAF